MAYVTLYRLVYSHGEGFAVVPNPALTPTEQSIYQAYQESKGQAAADQWLKFYLTKRGVHVPASAAEPPARATMQSSQRKARKWHQSELKTLLQRAQGREVWGEEALKLAATLVGTEWRTKLGAAYPLVLLFVKGAVEAGHRPGDTDANGYHCLSNLPSLGVLCADLAERETSYTEKTMRRWLSPSAPHAAALRCWLGWRTWITDTLLEYRKGEDPATGRPFRTGESVGPRIGGTLFRVRLEPLHHVSPERLAECTKERPSVIQPLKPELEHLWRDLEHERHTGKTWTLGPNSVRLEDVDVRIKENRTKYGVSKEPLLYKDNGKAPELAQVNVFHQNYFYPDIASLGGAMRLRLDVENSALWLMRCVEGKIAETRQAELLDRYRHAVWIAYKCHQFGGSKHGYELLLQAKNLAQELRRTGNTSIKDIGAYVWSVIEKQGFTELRRAYSYEKGRYLRIFSRPIARQLGLIA